MKTAGCILILITSWGIGFWASHQLYEKVAFWDHCVQLFRRMETQIRFGSRPLQEILWDCGQEFPPARFCAMAMEKGEPFPQAWRGTWEKACRGIFEKEEIRREECRFLQKWGEELGSSDTEGQLLVCRSASAEMEEHRRKARQEAEEKGKFYRVLGLCAGAAVVILLL